MASSERDDDGGNTVAGFIFGIVLMLIVGAAGTCGFEAGQMSTCKHRELCEDINAK
jgi:hypothetical protein